MRHAWPLVLLVVVACATEPKSGNAASDCKVVTPAIVSVLEGGIDGIEPDNSADDAMGVKSGSHENAWFISAEIQGSSIEGRGDIGTWLKTGDLGEDGFWLSVDGTAKQFTDFGHAEKRDGEVVATMSDPGAEESRKCVEDAA